MPYQNRPHYVEENPGTHYYCTCGESANKPYCDGSHDRLKTGKSPKEFTLAAPRHIGICDCGRSKAPPLCDGSHNR